ncbi:MAG TPA: META domain-containing protein [Candidatus Krumholzibacteria bacterium]|nr:META domain-containing protein [Candidatus Krumholzibacteria bacterium]
MKRTHAWVAVVLMVLAPGCQKKSEQAANSGATEDSTQQEVSARPGMLAVPGDSLARGPWYWLGTVTPVERIVPPSPDTYTLEFLPDSTLRALLDCNRGSGNYHVSGKRIRIGPIAATRMMCPPGSLDAEFGKQLDAARAWFMQGDTLMMDLFADGGTMHFVR